MFTDKQPPKFKDWVCVYETSLEYDAKMVKSFLDHRDLTTQILSQKDSNFDVNFGDLSIIFVYVPLDEEEEAREAIKEWQDGLTDLEDDDEE
ncbi:MAG: DUF2007 domain-containing protein [Balneolales bacterium]